MTCQPFATSLLKILWEFVHSLFWDFANKLICKSIFYQPTETILKFLYFMIHHTMIVGERECVMELGTCQHEEKLK